MWPFFISSMVLGFLDQLQIFSQLCLIELLGAWVFNRSGATQTVALNISKAFDRCGVPVVFTNIGLVEFQVRYMAYFFFSQ